MTFELLLNTSNWKDYKNDKYRIAFQYPSNMSVRLENEDPGGRWAGIAVYSPKWPDDYPVGVHISYEKDRKPFVPPKLTTRTMFYSATTTISGELGFISGMKSQLGIIGITAHPAGHGSGFVFMLDGVSGKHQSFSADDIDFFNLFLTTVKFY